MKLIYDSRDNRWCLGDTPLNCGRQVQIECTDINGDAFWVWGRFELANGNNPVFYTTFGRVSPSLLETRFRIAGGEVMTRYEAVRRQTFTTLADVDEEINALQHRWKSTLNELTRRDCELKLASCRKIREDLQQLPLPMEVAS